MGIDYRYTVIGATYGGVRARGIAVCPANHNGVAATGSRRISPLAKFKHEMTLLTLIATVFGVGIALHPYLAGGPAASSPITAERGRAVDDVGHLVDSAAMTGTGPLDFKKHVEEPSSNELRKAVGNGVVGVGLLAFPSIAGYVAQEPELDTNPLRAES